MESKYPSVGGGGMNNAVKCRTDQIGLAHGEFVNVLHASFLFCFVRVSTSH